MKPVIPVVAWSTAPPPIPPRSFSTEPPPTSNPPSEPTLVRQEPLDPRAFMMDPQRAEEVRDEARGLVHQALQEALAPLHFRVNELERRIEAMERTNRAVPPAPITTPQVAPRAVAPPPPIMPAYPAAYPALQPAPMAMAPMASAVYAPADPYSAGVSFPRPPAISTFDGDLPFDGARRKRKVLVMFAFLFLALLGGLLVSMAMSYSHPH